MNPLMRVKRPVAAIDKGEESAVLAKTDELSSTEKLLEVIRGHQGPEPSPSSISSAQGLKRAVLNTLPIKKPITVGVDIGESQIRMVKVSTPAANNHQIMDWCKVAIDPGIGKESNRFVDFFQQAVVNFTRHEPHTAFWTNISSVDVETRYLKIPKVPKKQIANAVYWTYRRESVIDESKDIFDYEVLGERLEDGVDKLDVLAYTAPRQQVEEAKKLFARAGLQLAGISIVPFAVQNLFRTGWVDAEKCICTLFIGRDWSRIAIYAGSNLILSRDIRAGLQGMVEAIAESLENDRSATPPLDLDAQADDAATTEGKMEKAERLLRRLTQGACERADAGPLEQDDKTFRIVSPALERVARQVERTIDHYRLQFSNDPVAKVYISGDLCAHPRVLAFFKDQVGIPFETVDPFVETDQGVRVAVTAPEPGNRSAFLPAVGLALSDNDITPNFLFTNKNKELQSRVKRFNHSIFIFSALFMAICIGAYVWQMQWIDQKKIQSRQLQNHLDRYVPRMDQNLIMQLAAENLGHLKSAQTLGQKQKSIAIIGEVCAKTPPSIRLDHLSIEMGVAPNAKAGKMHRVVLEGVVTGDRVQLETALAGFLVRLKDSSLFGQAQVIRQTTESRGRQEVLRFTAQIELT